MLPKGLVGHNPQASGLKFLHERGFWPITKITFHQVVSEQGKDFLRGGRRMQEEGERGTVLLKLESLWSYCHANSGSGR